MVLIHVCLVAYIHSVRNSESPVPGPTDCFVSSTGNELGVGFECPCLERKHRESWVLSAFDYPPKISRKAKV